jgi:hypothetical protein
VRILSDIPAVVLKLLQGADKMVELLDLPKLAILSDYFVYLTASESLPRRALRYEHVLILKRHQQVNVIGHDHRIGKQVSIAVEVQ